MKKMINRKKKVFRLFDSRRQALFFSVGLFFPFSVVFAGACFFGDSVTDIGAYDALTGKQIVIGSDAKTWSQAVAKFYGEKPKQALFYDSNGNLHIDNGNVYAMGGARMIDPVPPFPEYGDKIVALPVTEQVSLYLKNQGGVVPKGTTLFFWTNNDVIAAGSARDNNQAIDSAKRAANALVETLDTLRSAKANRFVILTIPDISKTYFGQHLDESSRERMTVAMNAYNQEIARYAKEHKNEVFLIDTGRLVDDLISDYRKYGFVAGNDAIACTGSPCTRDKLVTPDADQTYVFSDGLHLTPGAQAVLARYVIDSIQSFKLAASVADRLIQKTDLVSQSVREESQNMKIGWNFSVAQSYLNKESQPYSDQNKGSVFSILASYGTILSHSTHVGVQVGLNRDEWDGNLGKGSAYGISLTGFLTYRQVNWESNARAGYLATKNTIKRSVNLRNFHEDEKGTPFGSAYFASLDLMYWMDRPLWGWQHGPNTSLMWSHARLNGYEEDGMYAMRYGSQKMNRVRVALGYRGRLPSQNGWSQALEVQAYRNLNDVKRDLSYRQSGVSGGWTQTIRAPAKTGVSFDWQGSKPINSFTQVQFGANALLDSQEQQVMFRMGLSF